MNTTKLALEQITQFEKNHTITDQDLRGLVRNAILKRIRNCIPDPPIHKTELANDNILLEVDLTQGPTQNHYDYVFSGLIACDEMRKKIRPGDKLLETSSGSAGIAFAWACQKLAYKSVIFIPDYLPRPRIQLIEALASEVYFGTDKARYMEECASNMRAYFDHNKRLFRRETGQKLWYANHSRRDETIKGFSQVGEAIKDYLDKEDLDHLDFFTAAIGNGSTIVGIPGMLQELYYPDMSVIGYEPHQAAKYFKENRARWGQVIDSDRFLYGASVYQQSEVADVPGTGTLPGVDFPFNDQAVNEILADIVPFNPEAILKKEPADGLGKSSVVARHITKNMLEGQEGKVAACLIYDKANRY